jgi:hypothetical protein
MDQPPLFEGPVDAVQFNLVRTDPTGWRLRTGSHREGNKSWQTEVYENLSLPEAEDVILAICAGTDPTD